MNLLRLSGYAQFDDLAILTRT